jgi:hypothetical protein
MWFGVGKEAAMLLKIRQYVVITVRFFLVNGKIMPTPLVINFFAEKIAKRHPLTPQVAYRDCLDCLNSANVCGIQAVGALRYYWIIFRLVKGVAHRF